MAIINEKDLSEALKNDKDTIEIEGDLADKVIRIKATGSVAWAIAIGSIAVGLAAIFVTAGTGGAATPATVPTSALAAAGAVAILWTPTTISLIGIAVAAGGVSAGIARLNKLRDYKIKSKTKNKVILVRK